MTAQQRRVRIGLAIGGVMVVGAGWAVAHARRGGPPIDATRLSKVTRDDLARSVVATGRVQPITEVVQIKSKASGLLRKLYVDTGDHVHAGQVLAELDRDQLEAKVREIQAQLASAQANVRAAQATLARNRVDAEGVDVPFLGRQLARSRRLFQDGLIAQQVLDEAEKNYELAHNKQAVAHAALAVSQAQILQAQAQVAETGAALDNAREELHFATILAPIDGEILSRDVEVGDAVSSILVLGSTATLIMTEGDIRQVYVKGKVDESDIGKVVLGQPARITVEAFPGKKFQGQVTKIAPLGVEKDNVTTFEVRVSIQNPEDLLKANMTANAEIVLEEHKGVLTIPEGAVVYDKDRKASVQVPDASQPTGMRSVAVRLGISNGARAEVLNGLHEGEPVVLQQ